MKYEILVGKFTETGFGNLDSYFELNDLDLAKEKFAEQVEFEKKNVSDWMLRPTDYVEVSLVEYKEDIEDFECWELVHINYKGEEI